MVNKRWRLVAVVGLLLLPTRAWAHAHLRRSDPAANSRITAPPRVIHLWFSEKPDLALTAIVLRDANGKTVALGTPTAATDPLELSVGVADSLAAGAYSVEWHTAAADGHPSNGTFTFVVTASSSPTPRPAGVGRVQSLDISNSPAPTVDENASNASASAPHSLVRVVSFAAILCVIGAVVFRFLALPRAMMIDDVSRREMERRAAILGAGASAALILSALAHLGLEANAMNTISGAHAMSARSVAMESSWGATMRLQLGAAAILLVSFAVAATRSRSAWALCAGATILVALTPAMSGHAASVPHFSALATGSDFLHVAGAGAWFGTLLCVMTIGVPIAMQKRDVARWQWVGSLVNSFSPVALISAAIVAVSGVFASWLHLSHFSDLWSTRYGQVLFRKLIFVAAALLVGAYNYKKVQPRLDAEAGVRMLKKTATIELLAALVVLVFTGFLTGLEP